MVKRRARRTRRRKTVRHRKGRAKTPSTNRKAHWKAYKSLQGKVDKAWSKLRSNVKRKASPSIITRDRNQLLLLLGECNYMIRECNRCAKPRRTARGRSRRAHGRR